LIVRDLAAGPRRFVELQRVLPGISTEQLRSRLNRMVADGMLTRKRFREVPPRVDYELTERARELMPVLGELARWGYDWAWSSPRSSEAVDLGAIFRLAPGLLRAPAMRGTVEFIVNYAEDSEAAAYTFEIAEGNVTITEQPAEEPEARVRADVSAWIKAFSPGGDRDDLEVTGSSELAAFLLDCLGAAGPGRVTGASRRAA
jgi:DNA-binding HxlR family transcriptional regulator